MVDRNPYQQNQNNMDYEAQFIGKWGVGNNNQQNFNHGAQAQANQNGMLSFEEQEALAIQESLMMMEEEERMRQMDKQPFIYPNQEQQVQPNNEKARQEHRDTLYYIVESTYPLPMRQGSQEGPVETVEGNRALEKGRWANQNRRKAPFNLGTHQNFPMEGAPTKEEIERELGGINGWFTMFGLLYCGMWENPRMNVLFDTSKEDDARTSALTHGTRVASYVLDKIKAYPEGFFGEEFYAQLNRGKGRDALGVAHTRAKQCPMRPKSQQVPLPYGQAKANRRFTVKQRDSWVGHLMSGAKNIGASEEFEKKVGRYMATVISQYSPFLDEDTGKLDWMEEDPFGNHPANFN